MLNNKLDQIEDFIKSQPAQENFERARLSILLQATNACREHGNINYVLQTEHVRMPLFSLTCKWQYIDLAKLVMSCPGFDPDTVDDIGWTCLYWALQEHLWHVALQLISMGASLKAYTNIQGTVFGYLCGIDHPYADKVLKKILTRPELHQPVDESGRLLIDYPDTACNSPLHNSLQQFNEDRSLMLLEAGADYQTPVHHLGLGIFFNKRYAKFCCIPILNMAVRRRRYKVIDWLLNRKVDVNVRDKDGRSALEEALINHDEAIFCRLLEAGATYEPQKLLDQINTWDNQHNRSPFLYQIYKQHPHLIPDSPALLQRASRHSSPEPT